MRAGRVVRDGEELSACVNQLTGYTRASFSWQFVSVLS